MVVFLLVLELTQNLYTLKHLRDISLLPLLKRHRYCQLYFPPCQNLLEVDNKLRKVINCCLLSENSILKKKKKSTGIDTFSRARSSATISLSP